MTIPRLRTLALGAILVDCVRGDWTRAGVLPDYALTLDGALSQPCSAGSASSEDVVRVEAGVLTPFVWLFARVFYGHRQRCWRSLAASGFRYA